MNGKNRRQLVIGSVLIILGVGLLALQYVEGLSASVILFLIGALFVAGYLYSRAYGLLIPGCILLGLGLGLVGEGSIESFDEDRFVLLGLGVGFIALWVIPLIYQNRSIWWPRIPGAILIIVGLIQGNESFEKLFEVGWPLIIVLIGLLILAGAFGLIGRKREDETSDTEGSGSN
jgi:hypothetical protein